MSKLRLGIFGGTFSPPHIGHVLSAKSFVREMGLDRLLIMPTFLPPHKDEFGSINASDRFEMCKLAFGEVEKSEISDFEILQGGKSYTYLTLEAFSKENTELYFLCGTDMLLTLHTWKNPKRIFELATVCYVRRENEAENDLLINEYIDKLKREFSARIVAIPHIPLEASSTDLRRGLCNGILNPEALPQKVYEYISQKGLYR